MTVVVSAASGSARDWEELAALFRRLVSDAGASSAMLFLLPPEEPVLQLSMLYGTSWTVLSPWARIHVDEAVPAAEATRERRMVWVGDSEVLALHYPRLALMVPEHAVAAAPIFAGEPVRGAVCLLWPPSHPGHLGTEETAAIKAFCHRAGMLLDRSTRRGHPLLPGKRPMTLAAERSHTPDQAAALAAHDYAVRLPGAISLDLEGRTTFVSDAAGDLLGVGAADLLGARPWDRLRWLGGPDFEDRFRAAVIGHRPVHFTVTRAPDVCLSFELYPDAFGVSIHMASLAQESPAGQRRHVLPLVEPTETKPFHQLMHLAAGLTETVRVSDVAETIANQLLPAFGAAGLILMTASEGRLRIVGHRGYSTAFLSLFDGQSLASDNPPAKALTGHSPLFFGSFAEFQQTYPDAVQYGTRNAWAFLPLVIRGRPVGILVLSFDRTRRFPPTERNLLISVAGLVAQALDRACLHEASDDLARTLQTGLLPQRLPDVPGLRAAARYLPAAHGMDVGGDFYDLIRCGATTATAVIGDVQGHNVRAAALMGQLRTAVHTHAAVGMRPDDLLTRTNQVMCDLDPGLFASCLCIQLDLARRRALLATAGHLPPLLRHPDGRTEAIALLPGPLLGIVADADYPAVGIPLSSGLTLALYTDGLVEAPGIDIDDAVAALADRLAQASDDDLEDLTETLLGDASHHPRIDDIAMLLVRVTGSSTTAG
ncbi:Serine phosphatase RsbU, regulator of sigma subunit [Streptomyces sp. OV198]|uniref:SpoIIE family protein phosphatase n=1 Tax=Streptomyces sp. OV198 TaxID=1882787 RepID=UPI000BD6BE47|nr:SpoIIE family protein phosphatase [Streptomyces sp. OV198]SOF02404.1 Serine phosphatase RsbU, regulator of sigma subunit [Streptomyces sp. OV198]